MTWLFHFIKQVVKFYKELNQDEVQSQVAMYMLSKWDNLTAEQIQGITKFVLIFHSMRIRS